jgi:hypothetical protein
MKKSKKVKKNINVRDIKPKKDAKGGGKAVTGQALSGSSLSGSSLSGSALTGSSMTGGGKAVN